MLSTLQPCRASSIPRSTVQRSTSTQTSSILQLSPSNACRPYGLIGLQLLSLIGLTRLTKHPETDRVLEVTNLTILNWFLVRLGSVTEKQLVKVACDSGGGECVYVRDRVRIGWLGV